MGTRRRIAILGGGCGGCAAAWGLVSSPDAANLDITIYQLGWRLGGKGASGRNAALGNRIEEHGLHIWGGMYENAFAMMRSLYGQLDRPAGTPLSVWYDPKRPDDSAFLPHNRTTLAEFYNGQWIPWTLELPSDDGVPGDGRMLPSLPEYLELVLNVIDEALFGGQHPWQRQSAPVPAPTSAVAATSGALHHVVDALLLRGARALLRTVARRHVHRARAAIRALPPDPASHTRAHHATVLDALSGLEHSLGTWLGRWMQSHPGVRRIYMIVNLGNSIVRGVLADNLLVEGLDKVDGEEFSAWLKRHGATDLTLDGVLVRGWHDFFFAYVNGDGTRPSLSASSGLRTLFRYCFTYRGAFFWKMQAGMGDTIFTPAYQALKAKGVTFKFFHRVQDLHLSADRSRIQSVTVTRQVDLAPGVVEYAPTVNVKGVDSWPSEPLWGQIDPQQAARLRENQINLESWWADWPGVETFDIEWGRDFDDVILALPPSASQYLTQELAAQSPEWKAMLDGIASNQTVAAQLWLNEPLDKLGWTSGSTVGTVYANPLNTWANMDQLLKRETWGDGPGAPQCVVYFCGTTTDAEVIPAFTAHDFPAQQDARMKEMAQTWFDANLGPLYPRACMPGTPQVRWDLLVPATSAAGEGRFDNQYWHINIDPSERYVLSLPGTLKYRPRAHESGFSNLYLAGDWLRTGINAGCVEAAVMGGLQASRAIAGWPTVIVGEEV